jgi:hypothetical protein
MGKYFEKENSGYYAHQSPQLRLYHTHKWAESLCNELLVFLSHIGIMFPLFPMTSTSKSQVPNPGVFIDVLRAPSM